MRRHKFNAKPVQDDGHHFASKLEHKFYRELLIRQRAGEVVFFLRQVPLHLPGGVKYVCDYLVFNADGTASFVECKGLMTPTAAMKIKQAEALYPIKIEVVSKV